MMPLWVLFLALLIPLAHPASARGAPRDISVVSKSPRVGDLTLYQNSWAVLIGINDYRHPDIPRLRYAEKDVSDMKRALVRLGFPENQIFALTGRRATREGILALLGDQLPRRVGRADRVLVYFGGHGKDEMVGENAYGYLIPYDADPGRLFSTAVSMDALKRIAERLQTRHVLFVADACYSGFIGFNTRSIGHQGLLSDLIRKPAIQVLTAGTSGQQAQERDGNGLFTKILLDALEGSADKRGWGWVELSSLGAYVRDRVYAESNGAQRPVFKNLSGEGEFVFVLPGGQSAEGERQRLREEAELIRQERERLEAQRQKVEEQARLDEEKRKLEEEQRRLAEERERLARLERERQRPPSPPPQQQAVYPPGEKVYPKEITGQDGAPMVLVPAGEFIMGDNEGDDDEKPQRRVHLDGCYIDKYPVTNGRFARFAEATGHRTEAETGGGGRVWTGSRWETKTDASWRAPTGAGSSYRDRMDHPVVQVSWNDAKAYCGWAGKRLPTEAEWEKAARGTDGRKYPWGNEWAPDRLIHRGNSGEKTHPVDRFYNTHESPYGAADMAGNVLQWVADWYDKDYYRNAPTRNPQGPASGQYKVMRGGSWYFTLSWDFRATNRVGNYPKFRYVLGGFRCARGLR